MGVLKRDKDGVYRHVRGEVPWADNALDRIAEEDRMGTIERSDVIRAAEEQAEAFRVAPFSERVAARAAFMETLDAYIASQLAGAVEALESLRAAWNEHMATCPQHATLPSFDEINAWMNAPSHTASAAPPSSQLTQEVNNGD